mmetsp:Transcript_51204/g.120041  ORF Transcript_51204/g.120041 Transcript_51204/m.120041 type:complete len:350 (+) Transcript_51204:191-1240(+)
MMKNSGPPSRVTWSSPALSALDVDEAGTCRPNPEVSHPRRRSRVLLHLCLFGLHEICQRCRRAEQGFLPLPRLLRGRCQLRVRTLQRLVQLVEAAVRRPALKLGGDGTPTPWVHGDRVPGAQGLLRLQGRCTPAEHADALGARWEILGNANLSGAASYVVKSPLRGAASPLPFCDIVERACVEDSIEEAVSMAAVVLEVPLHAFDSHWRPQVSPKVEALAQLLTGLRDLGCRRTQATHAVVGPGQLVLHSGHGPNRAFPAPVGNAAVDVLGPVVLVRPHGLTVRAYVALAPGAAQGRRLALAAQKLLCRTAPGGGGHRQGQLGTGPPGGRPAHVHRRDVRREHGREHRC